MDKVFLIPIRCNCRLYGEGRVCEPSLRLEKSNPSLLCKLELNGCQRYLHQLPAAERNILNVRSYFCTMDEIVNRVKDSGLIAMDLAEFKPKVALVGVDLTDQLWQGLVLKEKDFRAWIKSNDWEEYSDQAVYVHCSADAIIPTWAYMLVASCLESCGANYVIGTKETLSSKLLIDNINALNLEEFQDGRIIIKGCADVYQPEVAMSELVRKLQPVAKSIMYGEPCSTVPVFKRK